MVRRLHEMQSADRALQNENNEMGTLGTAELKRKVGFVACERRDEVQWKDPVVGVKENEMEEERSVLNWGGMR